MARDANFTQDDVEGVSVVAGAHIADWHAATYGDSVADDTLERVMASIRHTPPLHITLSRLTPGLSYKLQLLFAESCCPRGFDVVLDGETIVDDFAPYVIQGVIDNRQQGVVVAYSFVAQSSATEIVLDGSAVANPVYTDHNPIINGLTLETGSGIRLLVKLEPGSLSLCWDAAAVGFTLEATTSLENPVQWTAVPGVANNQVTLPIQGTKQFYRLHK